MDFYNVFKRFFGIPNSIPPNDFRFGQNYPLHDDEDQSPAVYNEEEENWHDFHKFFEEQMQHILSSFGLGAGGSVFDDAFRSQEPQMPASLRDQYLKPGFDHPSSSKADTDMDGKVNIEELNTVMKPSEEHVMPVTPYKRPNPQTRFFGQSISTRTVMRPDGSVETTTTVTDNQGNRETTVTRRDQHAEHTITTRIGANGEETKEEQIVHRDGDAGEFGQRPLLQLPREPRSWFDAFLK